MSRVKRSQYACIHVTFLHKCARQPPLLFVFYKTWIDLDLYIPETHRSLWGRSHARAHIFHSLKNREKKKKIKYTTLFFRAFYLFSCFFTFSLRLSYFLHIICFIRRSLSFPIFILSCRLFLLHSRITSTNTRILIQYLSNYYDDRIQAFVIFIIFLLPSFFPPFFVLLFAISVP